MAGRSAWSKFESKCPFDRVGFSTTTRFAIFEAAFARSCSVLIAFAIAGKAGCLGTLRAAESEAKSPTSKADTSADENAIQATADEFTKAL